jgi:UDP-N-acetylmuramate--alanine ligase
MNEIRGPVHLVGIGGMHLSAIGQVLLTRGVAVTGSDLRLSPLTARLEALGATVFEGHDAANVGEAQLVVTTAAAGSDNPELLEAQRRGIPIMQRGEMVARLMQGKRVIAVAGSHGKTTTSSLIAYTLVRAGRYPMYLLGGESLDLGGNAAWGEGEHCVVEADEYKRAFHAYQPAVAVITNVEADHLDYFGTAEAYEEAFVEFGRRVERRLLVGADDPGAARVAAALAASRPRAKLETYGIGEGHAWTAREVELTEAGASFDVYREGDRIGRLAVGVPGRHFVLNSLAATAVCLGEGVTFDQVRAAVADFRGARRRFERIGEGRGVLVMDDYAHHPSEVRATLETARRRFAGRRLIGVYQPHTYSRTAYLWDEWITCWGGLDALVVLETYAAREPSTAGKGAEDLAKAITRVPTFYARDFDDAARQAVELAKPGDVIFTIGAGDVGAVGPKIVELLQ